MMLTTKGRYSVMAMVDLAKDKNGGPIALADIAERQDIALTYLEQIFARLKKEGLVRAFRGPGGGYMLTRSPEEIFISDIISAVDEKIKMTRCDHNPAKGCMSHKVRCLTHDLWDGLGNQIFNYLRSVSLADVVNRRTNVGVQRAGDPFAIPAQTTAASKPASTVPQAEVETPATCGASGH
ncbi:MAG: Rrf2 family transcriptional regulator [Proteobacteria bacterium]|nr:Rrf2 family transcriptional regulator [Pseudomonadota bacterium]